MDFYQVLFLVLTNLLQAAAVILSGFCINLIRSKTQHTKFSKYMDYAKIAVTAIEQTMGLSTGAIKKKAVETFLYDKIGKALSKDEIDKLIEAAVFDLNLNHNSKSASKDEILEVNKYAL